MPSVAYLLRRFPVLSNTFVTAEILALRRKGIRVHVFSLLPPDDEVMSQSSREVASQDTDYAPFLSPGILSALAAETRRSPVTLGRALRTILAERAAGSGALTRALMLFPKAVHFGRIARQLGVTHVHSHWAGLPTAMAGAVAAVCGAPYSFTVHTKTEIEQTPQLKWQVQNSSGIRVNSKANKARLMELAPDAAGKIHFARSISTVPLNQASLPSKVFQQKPLRFVAVGRLVPMKGFDDLVRACSLLHKQGIAFHATIIGDGPQRMELESIAEAEGLSDEEMMFIGAQPHEKTIEIMRHTSFLVAPSVNAVENNGHRAEDGLPLVIVEAMACGLAVISTAVGGISEVVLSEQTGLIVPQRDPPALAAAIRRFVDEPAQVRTLGSAAQRLINAEFDTCRAVSALCRLFGTAGACDREPGPQAGLKDNPTD